MCFCLCMYYFRNSKLNLIILNKYSSEMPFLALKMVLDYDLVITYVLFIYMVHAIDISNVAKAQCNN